jgi:hypothetical protein
MTNSPSSALLLLVDATVATEPRRRNGEEDQMVLAPCAMRVVFITPN